MKETKIDKYRILTARDHRKLENPQIVADYLTTPHSRDRGRFRIRNRLRSSINELTTVLNYEGFTEDDRNAVFKPELLNSLFSAIFRYETKMNTKTKNRLIKLSRFLIVHLGSRNFASKISKELYALLLKTKVDDEPYLGLKALYLTREWMVVYQHKPRKKP